MPTPGPLAACARGKNAGGRCRARSATASAGSSAPRPAPSACTKTSPPRRWSRCRPSVRRRPPAHRLHRDGLSVDALSLSRAAGRRGSSCAIVPAEDDLTVRTDRVLDAIDDTTAVVAFSHVLFRTSYIMDAAAIVRRAHEVGAAVDSRHLSVGRDRPARRRRARRRLRGRRLLEVALRRSWERVSLHPPRSC